MKSETEAIGLLAFVQVILLTVGRCKCNFSECKYISQVKPGHVLFLNSPNYPEYNRKNTSCLYKAVADQDSEIVLQCDIDIPRGPTACNTDYFYISREGDENLHGADQLCGSGSVTRTSLFRNLVVAYVSTGSSGKGGRFNCTFTTRPQSCDCGWSQSTRIVGGEEASIGEFPSMVRLYHVPTKTGLCGGTIINHRTILTAAHCIKNYRDPSEIAILAGFHDFSSTTETPYATVYKVYKYIEYPGYNNKTIVNDILLLQTTEDIEWTRGVGPICLPVNQSSNEFNGANVDLVGWGTTSFDGNQSNSLQKASVKIITDRECKSIYSDIESSQVCTYFPHRDACQSDSGGPVVYKDATRQFQLGIISYGYGCGRQPGVNTRITSFMNWILSNSVGGVCEKEFA